MSFWFNIYNVKLSCDVAFATDSVSIPDVRNLNDNMHLGLTLTRMPAVNGLMVRVCVCTCVCTCVCVCVLNPFISETRPLLMEC